MTFPVDITFRDMEVSPAVEARVRRWSQRLGRVFDRIQHCSVVIERPHRHHRHGQRFDVRLELAVPHRVIAVSRSPGDDDTHESVYVALADAFRAARRRLQDHARITRGDVKLHAS